MLLSAVAGLSWSRDDVRWGFAGSDSNAVSSLSGAPFAVPGNNLSPWLTRQRKVLRQIVKTETVTSVMQTATKAARTCEELFERKI